MATETLTRRQVEFPTHERPHTDISTPAMLGIGAGLGVAVFGIAYTGVLGHFVKDLLMGDPTILIERVIFQGTITFVWSLSVANVILKLLKMSKERATIDESLVPEGTNFTDTDNLIGIYERVKNRPNLTDSLGLTRVARVLAMWINTGDYERTAAYARNQGDIDAVVSDSSFRRNRLFIWAMPLLGFVGTVFGVAAGISGFAAFLRQQNVTAAQITEQVGNITTGLAVAFMCTLLGLLTAGLAAFPSLLAERKEEEVLGEIDEFVEDRLLSHMPSSGTIAAEASKFPMEELTNAIREGMEGLTTQSKFPVEELAQAIDAGFRRLPNPDRYEEVFTRAVSKAADTINTKYEEFQTNYERRVGELGSQLGGKLEAVSNSFNAGSTKMMSEFTKAQDKTLESFAKNDQKLTERFEELSESITTVGKEMAESFGEANERYVDAVSELDKKEIQRWEKMVADFNQLSVRVAESFKQSVSTLDSASGRYADRIQQSVEALTGQLDKVTQLGNEIDKVLHTTQSMEATLRQVGSSDEFRQTLANIRNHLTTSDELLKQLSRPRKMVFAEQRAED
jgi:biopolymer transport protein ExbB/TolQ/prefoldin subunit 5